MKELARQTAKATDDISYKITSIQTNTDGAVEEQSATTNDMTRNAADAARRSTETTNNIAGVAEAAQGASTSSQESQKAADDLAQMAAQLRSLVGQFKISVVETRSSESNPPASMAAHA